MPNIFARLGILAIAAMVIPVYGAVAQEYHPGDPGTCWANSKDKNQPFKKNLWDGYEVSLGPVKDGEAEEGCTAAIYRADGKVVYRTTGFNVLFDEQHTGMDFDGDGKPEVVFRTDTGGGNACCWASNIITLSPKPHKLFDIPGYYPRLEKDVQGKMIIWTTQAGPYGWTSSAMAPAADRAWRVKDGKMVDVTPEFCGRLSGSGDRGEDWQHPKALTPEGLRKLQAQGPGPWENEEVISALLSRALQYVYCREPKKALSDLDLWPDREREKMRADFAAVIREDYPELAERIAGPAPKQSKP